MTLTSWSFAWFSASVHVHHQGHDCHHDVAKSVPHAHSVGMHSHCHGHEKTAHRHSESSDPVEKSGFENLQVAAGDCPLCDLIALELAAHPTAEVAPAKILIARALLLHAMPPASAARYSLRGRAPPVC